MLAVLYDIHGNLPAVDAVLQETQLAGADRYLLGGDYALFGAWPAETVARLRELDATWIRGNVDRWVDDPGQDDLPDEVRGAIGRCRELLDAETIAELGALPARSWRAACATATHLRSRSAQLPARGGPRGRGAARRRRGGEGRVRPYPPSSSLGWAGSEPSS